MKFNFDTGFGSVAVCLFVCCSFSATVAGQDQETKVAPNPAPLIRLGRIESPKIFESSGLAIASHFKNAFWTHNDSGQANEVYLVSFTGKTLATTTLVGARNIDWESMCRATINSKPHLVIGDVGDNLSRRSSCYLYVFPEPKTVAAATANHRPARIEFKYPDGARNCEAIACDNSSGKVWLVEKKYVDDNRSGQPGIYTIPLQLTSTEKAIMAERIGEFPVRNVTGMSFSPDGKFLIIRNYLNAHLYTRLPDKNWRESIKNQIPRPIGLPIQRQGEAICFTEDSKSVIVTSEVGGQPVWQVNLDAQISPSEKNTEQK